MSKFNLNFYTFAFSKHMISGLHFSKWVRIIAITLLIAVSTITIHTVLLTSQKKEKEGAIYTRYNNFIIFKNSWDHLKEGKDLYIEYPSEHFDFYKYSPTFPFLMAPFALFPEMMGLFLWNLFNVFVLFLAILKIPSLTEKQKLLVFPIIIIELITSLQNSQSNGLLAGLLILGIVFMEKGKPLIAAFFIVSTIFIKIFGIVALVIFLLYPKKAKSVLYITSWSIILALLPLLIISFSQLEFLYHSWLNLLQHDESVSYGISVAGWLNSWFGLNWKLPVLIAGTVGLLTPLIFYKRYSIPRFRLLFLASVMIWIVIFNHKAESPTFIIAITGVAIWFVSGTRNAIDIILLGLALIFTVLSPTDIFPPYIRNNYFVPYTVKVVPCILIWIKINFEFYSGMRAPLPL